MILLNLLPEEKRMEYELTQSARFLIAFFQILLTMTAAIAILLVVARISLRHRVEEIFRPQTTNDAITTEFEGRIHALNALVKTVDTIQERSPAWSQLLHDLATRVPKTIRLSTLTLDNTTALDIRGQAATRNDLLEFRNRLSESPFFTDIQFPSTNLLQSESIPFEIHATVQFPSL